MVSKLKEAKTLLDEKYEAYFAEPAYSADNASGTAYLCGLQHMKDNV